jgi:hypothetical protein
VIFRLALFIFLAFVLVGLNTNSAKAHFFGATKVVDNYQIIFMPEPSTPYAGDNSTLLNFSVLDNGTNIVGIYSAVVITERNSGSIIGQIPYRQYEFSDFTIPYAFQKPGIYVVTLETRVIGDEKYQATPLVGSFDIVVEDPSRRSIPIDELMLLYVTPAAAVIAGLVVYLHSKKKL